MRSVGSPVLALAAALIVAASTSAQPPGEGKKPDRPGDGGPGGPPPGFKGGFPRPGQVLPGFLQGRLKLTPEQRKQVEELQKEVDDRLAKILTEEQKKTLQEAPKGFGPPGGPGR